MMTIIIIIIVTITTITIKKEWVRYDNHEPYIF